MTDQEFWTRFIDMCQTDNTRLQEITAALFGNDDRADDIMTAGLTGPDGLIPLMVQRIVTLETQRQEMANRLGGVITALFGTTPPLDWLAVENLGNTDSLVPYLIRRIESLESRIEALEAGS